ncbi:hypothetical protein CEUSTIGMA_g1238.t1 [Chlamydomonas eustigma]|uniref:Coenzyme Q-binding protein COQ10 START domain-containing protein n=1 Tax=Chlamydomonas eustigma TaxID=1157962 RepID=A0A250WSH8_9CHLO|nr:hypothetical protein CEUSTIGMA_g1238.t1 [Chlamydomonas eustigma]|eukprot:GAX73787.1 hypothetical protein CEUSTIGMA_g1238.t1 [Chlamydomonas eustigma]
MAPLRMVWECLTDYDHLDKFIPSLVENKCLERRPQGALLKQVGAVKMGVQFSAQCKLECSEFQNGLPEEFCSTSGDGSDGLLPHPKDSIPGVKYSDISFVQVEGDFQAFRGVWRMQPEGPRTTRLSYSLYVQPMSWLPVRLIQNRIQQEVITNLSAIKNHSEKLFSLQDKGAS